MTLEIKIAEELIDPALEARWAPRRAARQTEVLQWILRAFVERGGPIPAEAVTAAFPDRQPRVIRETLVALDEDDLVQVRAGQVDMAYPFSAIQTPFVVQLADGQDRYACCAIDALGIAPMLGQHVHIRSQCHHCRTSLQVSVDPDGPSPEARGVMVWIGKQAEGQRRIVASL